MSTSKTVTTNGSRTAAWRMLMVTTLAAAALTALVAHSQRLPEGPEPIAWDQEACAHCHMHVGDPRFAAQMQTTDGRVLNFDDPGCLFAYERERRPSAHATYFHSYRGNDWIPRREVGFVTATATPMGFGLGATRANASGAISYADAARRAQAPGNGVR